MIEIVDFDIFKSIFASLKVDNIACRIIGTQADSFPSITVDKRVANGKLFEYVLLSGIGDIYFKQKVLLSDKEKLAYVQEFFDSNTDFESKFTVL